MVIEFYFGDQKPDSKKCLHFCRLDKWALSFISEIKTLIQRNVYISRILPVLSGLNTFIIGWMS